MRDLSGGIGPGVLIIMALATPETEIFAGGGACFFLRGLSESLGVEWRFCICLVLSWGFCICLALDFI